MFVMQRHNITYSKKANFQRPISETIVFIWEGSNSGKTVLYDTIVILVVVVTECERQELVLAV